MHLVATKNVGASASTTRAHDQISEKINRARISGQVFPNLLTPSGEDLGAAAKFFKAWNAVDWPEGSSVSAAAAHPAVPSRVLQSLHVAETSVAETKHLLEVILLPFAFTYSLLTCVLPPVTKIRFEWLVLLGVRKSFGLNLK